MHLCGQLQTCAHDVGQPAWCKVHEGVLPTHVSMLHAGITCTPSPPPACTLGCMADMNHVLVASLCHNLVLPVRATMRVGAAVQALALGWGPGGRARIGAGKALLLQAFACEVRELQTDCRVQVLSFVAMRLDWQPKSSAGQHLLRSASGRPPPAQGEVAPAVTRRLHDALAVVAQQFGGYLFHTSDTKACGVALSRTCRASCCSACLAPAGAILQARAVVLASLTVATVRSARSARPRLPSAGTPALSVVETAVAHAPCLDGPGRLAWHVGDF